MFDHLPGVILRGLKVVSKNEVLKGFEGEGEEFEEKLYLVTLDSLVKLFMCIHMKLSGPYHFCGLDGQGFCFHFKCSGLTFIRLAA